MWIVEKFTLTHPPALFIGVSPWYPKTGSGTMMWFNSQSARHRSADEVLRCLSDAGRHGANLLLNTGLLGDGSIHPNDAATLRQVGRWIREHGFPTGHARGLGVFHRRMRATCAHAKRLHPNLCRARRALL